MTHDFLSPDEGLTAELRALYAPPAGESYWDSLEARVLAHVSRAEDATWFTELAAFARPAMAAAAMLVLIAGAAMVQARQVEASSAYDTALRGPLPEPFARAASNELDVGTPVLVP